MTRIADILNIEHRNVRSVNVEREVESASPLSGFVVTEQVLDGVRRFLAACSPQPQTRAWSITGPYGAGKSSFAHLLTALMGPENDAVFTGAKRLVARADRDLGKRLSTTRRELGVAERGFIRAVATAEREPVSAAVARALYRGAETYWGGRRGRRPDVLHELHVATAAASRGDYPDPRFVRESLERLLVVAPVILVVDELGKALEFAADRSREGDLYLLQQLAEGFSASPRMTGCLFALQHLAFEDYATGLPAARRREWRKVQGRFEDVVFSGGHSHSARIIGESLSLADTPSGIETAMRAGVRDLIDAAPDVEPILAGLGGGVAGYPLHPTVVPALVELAGRFGQHDRSLMAFLTSDAPDAVPAFSRTHEISDPPEFIRLPDLYDYFVEGAASLSTMGEDAARLREIRGRVGEAHGLDADELACLKAVAVLNLTARGSFRASQGLVIQAVAGPDASRERIDAVESTLRRLQSRGLVTYREFADEHRVWQGSDFDVAAAISDVREELAQDAVLHGAPLDHIAAAHPARPLVARRHSQRVEVLRYFEARYATDLPSEPPSCDRPDADGLLLYLLAAPPRGDAVPAHTRDGRPLVVIATRHASELTDAAIDAAAAHSVLTKNAALRNDVVARREVRHRAALAQAALSERVAAAFDPTRRGVTCFANGRAISIARQREFSELLSQLCDETYALSPIVRNEMLNRRELTSQGAKTRRELLERIFVVQEKRALGIEGYGPDRAMYESVLAATGVHAERHGELRIGPPNTGSGLESAWTAINEFFDAASEAPLGVDALYSKLASPPYGMKDGPIPVLIACALLDRADDVFVFEEESFLPRLGAEHFERLVKTPERFAVKRASLLGVRANVFRELEQLVGSSANALPKNVRNASTLAVVRPLIARLQSLPEYSRQTSRLSPAAQRVRAALETTREPDELLFVALPKACGAGRLASARPAADQGDSADFIATLKSALDELGGAYDALLQQLAAILRSAFDTRGPEHALREELRSRARHLVEHVIDRRMRSFLLMATNEDFEDQEWLEAIATVLAQKPPASWSDTDIAVFESAALEVSRPFRRLELLHLQMAAVSQDGFAARRITLTQPDGIETSRLVWLDESRSPALSEILSEAISQAERTVGTNAGDALLALLAEEVLADAPDISHEEADPQRLRRATP